MYFINLVMISPLRNRVIFSIGNFLLYSIGSNYTKRKKRNISSIIIKTLLDNLYPMYVQFYIAHYHTFFYVKKFFNFIVLEHLNV